MPVKQKTVLDKYDPVAEAALEHSQTGKEIDLYFRSPRTSTDAMYLLKQLDGIYEDCQDEENERDLKAEGEAEYGDDLRKSGAV